MKLLKRLNFDKEELNSVFCRSSAFYAVVALVLVSVSLFAYICVSIVDKDKLSAANASLVADKSALISESEAKDKIIEDQKDENERLNSENAQLNDEKEQLESEKEQIKSESEAEDKNDKETLNEIMDYIGMEYVSRSGNDIYDSIDKIETVAYMIRDTWGENEDTAEYLDYLAGLKSDIEARAEYDPDYDPLEHGTLTSRFGYRSDPNGKGSKYHSGIDVWNSYGTPIYAAGAGVVEYAGDSGEYGLLVIIDHGYGYKTAYAHCSTLTVSKGATVAKGQLIARIGATGNATGNHLHFEVRLNDERVNPLDYVFPEFS